MYFPGETVQVQTIRCPYDPEHLMPKQTFIRHKDRCKANNKNEFRQCPYDVYHVIRKTDFDKHCLKCPSRVQYKEESASDWGSDQSEADQIVIPKIKNKDQPYQRILTDSVAKISKKDQVSSDQDYSTILEHLNNLKILDKQDSDLTSLQIGPQVSTNIFQSKNASSSISINKSSGSKQMVPKRQIFHNDQLKISHNDSLKQRKRKAQFLVSEQSSQFSNSNEYNGVSKNERHNKHRERQTKPYYSQNMSQNYYDQRLYPQVNLNNNYYGQYDRYDGHNYSHPYPHQNHLYYSSVNYPQQDQIHSHNNIYQSQFTYPDQYQYFTNQQQMKNDRYENNYHPSNYQNNKYQTEYMNGSRHEGNKRFSKQNQFNEKQKKQQYKKRPNITSQIIQ